MTWPRKSVRWAKPCGELYRSQASQSRSQCPITSPGQARRQRPHSGPRHNPASILLSGSTGTDDNTAVSTTRGPILGGQELFVQSQAFQVPLRRRRGPTRGLARCARMDHPCNAWDQHGSVARSGQGSHCLPARAPAPEPPPQGRSRTTRHCNTCVVRSTLRSVLFPADTRLASTITRSAS